MITEPIIEALANERAAYYRRVLRARTQVHHLSGRRAKEILRTFAEVRNELTSDLTRLSQGGNSWPAHRRPALMAEINQAASQITRHYGQVLDGATRAAWEMGEQTQPRATRRTRLDLGDAWQPTAPRVRLEIAAQLRPDLVRHVSDSFRVAAAREVLLVTAGLRTAADATNRIAALLETEPDRYGRYGTVANQAARILNTEVATVYNLADRARMEEAAAHVPGLRKVWDATGDFRVRAAHQAAEERYREGGSTGPILVSADFRVGGERCKGPHDPRLSASNRVNCRCIASLHHPDWRT